MSKDKPKHQGLKVIALIKALRGTIAFAAGIFLFRVGPTLNDAGELEVMIADETQDPTLLWLFNYLGKIDDTVIYSIGALVMTLASIRFTEAVGLWFKKRWAEWLALLTSLAYIPFELFNLASGFNLAVLFILLINITICVYLLRILRLKESPQPS